MVNTYFVACNSLALVTLAFFHTRGLTACISPFNKNASVYLSSLSIYHLCNHLFHHFIFLSHVNYSSYSLERLFGLWGLAAMVSILPIVWTLSDVIVWTLSDVLNLLQLKLSQTWWFERVHVYYCTVFMGQELRRKTTSVPCSGSQRDCRIGGSFQAQGLLSSYGCWQNSFLTAVELMGACFFKATRRISHLKEGL